MLPILPRIMLWKDKELISQFFELDSINEEFSKVIDKLAETPQLVTISELKIFNEVYYQTTRIVFEHPMPSDIDEYIKDIKGNLGWYFAAELVLTIIYFVLLLRDGYNVDEQPLNKFFVNSLREQCAGSVYWKPFEECFQKISRQKRLIKYKFKPSPYPPLIIKYDYVVSWDKITRDYELSCVEYVLSLWEDMNDRYIISKEISKSLENRVRTSAVQIKTAQVERYFKNYFSSYLNNEKTKDEETNLKEKLREKNKEIEKLNNRVAILEMANNNLKKCIDTIVPDNNEETKTFSLKEIVDYCKGCVDWNDTKSIVAMLNKFLRNKGCTEEESKMVDGIEDIFKKRLGIGITVENANIGVNSPGNIIANKVTEYEK